jgi:hypothetical protein
VNVRADVVHLDDTVNVTINSHCSCEYRVNNYRAYSHTVLLMTRPILDPNTLRLDNNEMFTVRFTFHLHTLNYCLYLLSVYQCSRYEWKNCIFHVTVRGLKQYSVGSL